MPCHMRRVGQNRICTPYMTVYLVIFLPKYRIYTVYTYKWLWPTLHMRHMTGTPLLFARTEVRLSAKFLTHSAKFLTHSAKFHTQRKVSHTQRKVSHTQRKVSHTQRKVSHAAQLVCITRFSLPCKSSHEWKQASEVDNLVG
jgi:hypothetical protein